MSTQTTTVRLWNRRGESVAGPFAATLGYEINQASKAAVTGAATSPNRVEGQQS